MTPYYQDAAVTLYLGNCVEVLAALPDVSIDACVCDPPYDLTANKRGGTGEASLNLSSPAGRCRVTTGGGFMGKQWDATGIAFDPAFWSEVLRVLKPGAHLLACGGTRTYHRLGCGIEDAGFEIRDCLAWLFGSGFPKSLNLGEGLGTALKPAHEPIVLARKPFKGTIAGNVAAHGTGALNIDACRIPFTSEDDKAAAAAAAAQRTSHNGLQGTSTFARTGDVQKSIDGYVDRMDKGRWPANVCLDEWYEQVLYLKYNIPSDAAAVIREYFDGYGDVPTVSGVVRDLSGQSENRESEILQPCLLCGLDECQCEGRRPSDEGAQALGLVAAEDARDEAGDVAARQGSSAVEGRASHRARLCDGVPRIADREGTRQIPANGDSEPERLYSGASACRGAETRPAAVVIGDCPSSQREQAGQPVFQPRTLESRSPHARTSEGLAGDDPAARRERTATVRTLEVPESVIPPRWLAYFADTGKTIRRGAALVLDEQSGELTSGGTETDGERVNGSIPLGLSERRITPRFDSGGASRFYYVAKPSREERDYGIYSDETKNNCDISGRSPAGAGLKSPRAGAMRTSGARNFHPTVKPVELMRWLVKLVTPINGVVLDPFLGSGTTGMACRYEQRRFIGIEREAEYMTIAERRIRAVAPLFAEATCAPEA